ncbi:hypothetical protein M434DRAFT_397809 [Hypoxylon sp. CO27-5]|nr:hypothetical protein M434DRAFT_397809 [Hypoxylon sp. CO27-5]
MGTRGLYVYVWRRKHYVYYNHWDSYPSGLGKILVSMIPSDPDKYKEWLAKQRSTYSEISEKLEHVFMVSLNTLRENRSIAAAGVEKLHTLPSYQRPDLDDWWIEWIYKLDLDEETFLVDGYSCGLFDLSKIPPNWESLLEDAESLPTADILPKTPLTSETILRYSKLKPSVVQPKRRSGLNEKPAFIACKYLYDLFAKMHENNLREASETLETDFLFREAVFAVICLASCSPDWVRLVSTTNMMYSREQEDFYDNVHRDWRTENNRWNYGVILDNDKHQDSGEFTSRFLRGFHLEGKEAGSAPKCTSYWFSNALVFLQSNILSQDSYYEAIVSAVTKGRSQGRTHFNAIIVSIKHFILLKVSDGRVQHTKRLRLATDPGYGTRITIPLFKDHEDERQEPDPQDKELGSPSADDQSSCDGCGIQQPQPDSTAHHFLGDDDWMDEDNEFAFDILAHFFEATQMQRLKPSTARSRGVFPNEIYKHIIEYLDRQTNKSCLEVSRAFRDFASDTFFMDNELTLVSRPGSDPECFHPAAGFLGPFYPVPFGSVSRSDDKDLWYKECKSLQWILVIGTSNGSASMESEIVVWFPSRLKGTSSAQRILHDELVRGNPFVNPLSIRHELGEMRISSASHIDYNMFERFLPTQATIAASSDVAALYSMAVYVKLGIISKIWDLDFDSPKEHIARLPINTFMQVIERDLTEYSIGITFAITWNKQPCEDTSEGWRIAAEEAQVQASIEYLRQAYVLWFKGTENNTKRDMAIIICIGAKFKIFHIASFPEIPPRNLFPEIDEVGKKIGRLHKLNVSYDNLELWDAAGLQCGEFEKNLRWIEIDEMLSEMGNRVADDVPPLDVLNLKHRPKIESAFEWVQKLGNSFDRRNS